MEGTVQESTANELWGYKDSTPGAPSKPVGVTLDAKDLSYSVNLGGTWKRLLRNVNLHLDPGDMCALMGPSGAGKSTLLDLIADRKLVGVWSGDILINQVPRSPWFNRDSAYVLQDDVHIGTLTCEETIRYAAWSRMPEGTTVEQREARVKQLLEMMGISHVKDSYVGDALHKGISGGQMKRLSIAVEIVSLPNLIFLDEPTSGLDSSIAFEVMAAVKNLATQNRTCVSTIHQPSPEVFALFDKCVLLSAGRVIYFGAADEAMHHFTRPELGYRYEEGTNSAEFIIDVCGGNILPEDALSDTPRQPEELEELFKNSKFNVTKPVERQELLPPLDTYTRRHATTKLTQFNMLMHRSWTAMWRDYADLKANIGKNVVLGILIGIVFYGEANLKGPLFEATGIPTAEQLTMTSLLFFAMMYCLMSNLQSIPALCNKNLIYRRDLASFGYCASPYWASSCIVNLPLMMISHTIFITLIFILCEFPGGADYYFFLYFLLFFANMTSFYFAMTLAAGTGNAQLAFAIFPVAFLFLCMFAGFTIAVDDVPEGWIWAPYVSYARWVFQGLMINEYNRFDGNDDTYGYGNGAQVIENYDFQDFNKYNSFWIVFLNMGALMLFAYYCMRPPTSHLTWAAMQPENKSADDTEGPISTLKQSLIGNDELANRRDKDGGDVKFSAKSTYDVAWYRANTGEVQQSRGCRLVFRNLTYSVLNQNDPKSGQIKLLIEVSGRAHPGEMCALMGASGAGKSTLLDVLAGRKTTGDMTGDILFNGTERTPSVMRSSAYVMQDNVHIGVLTVKESLRYAALLRLSEKITDASREKQIQKVMDMLGLAEVCDVVVGDENVRGISGGQCKRLSIGVEIISLPDLIFLDEPTTGLDSSISYEVMSAVRNLANQNRTVICTIHQPSPLTYMLFDKLLLMASGRVIYFGPSRDIVNYFATSPYKFAYKTGSNPADYLIAVAGGFLPASNGKTIPGTELASYYSGGELYRLFIENIDTMIAMDLAAVGPGEADDIVSDYNTGTLNQMKTLCHRVVVKTVKQRKPTVTTFMRHLVMSMFYGSIFWKLEVGTNSTCYTNRLSLLFFCLMFMILGHQQAIPALFEDRLVFYRERGARAYGALPYWFSSWFLQLPLIFINTLVFSSIVYSMSDLNPREGGFSYFWGQMFLTSCTGLFMAQLIASLAPSAQAAISLFPVALFFVVAFAGYIVYIPEFSYWLRCWAPYGSFMRWGFQGLVLNEFSNNDALPLSQQYIDNLAFNTFNMDYCQPVIFVFTATFATMVLCTLKFINFEER